MRLCVWDGTGWEYYLAELRKKGDEASKKEQDSIRDMRIVQEMYARGFEFLPIDIYRSHANRFQIIDGKLLPPLNSIDGMGEKVQKRWRKLQKMVHICPKMILETVRKQVRRL